MISAVPDTKTEDLKVQASLGNFVRLCLKITSSSVLSFCLTHTHTLTHACK